MWIGRTVRRNFCFIWGVCAEEFISRQHLLFICRACCLLVPREGVFLWRRVASETWRHQILPRGLRTTSRRSPRAYCPKGSARARRGAAGRTSRSSHRASWAYVLRLFGPKLLSSLRQ